MPEQRTLSTRGTLFSTFLARLNDRADRVAWANLVDDTRAMWEPHGYRVHVSTNQRRVVISGPGLVLPEPTVERTTGTRG